MTYPVSFRPRLLQAARARRRAATANGDFMRSGPRFGPLVAPGEVARPGPATYFNPDADLFEGQVKTCGERVRGRVGVASTGQV